MARRRHESGWERAHVAAPRADHWACEGPHLTSVPASRADAKGAGREGRRAYLVDAYQVRVGVEWPLALETVAQLNANQIPLFHPFPAPGDPIDVTYRLLLNQRGPTVDPVAMRWASEATARHQAFMQGMATRTQQVRHKLDKLSLGSMRDWTEALKMADGSDSFIGSLTLSCIANGGTRPVKVKDPAKLYRAAMKNPHLRHFFHAFLYYIVSVINVWKDRALWRSVDKNDWTDLSMTLYLGHRDAMVTEDGLLRAVLAGIQPPARVVAASAL